MSTFEERVNSALAAAKISQREACRRANLSESTLAAATRRERAGKPPNLETETLKKLAKVLDVPFEELAGGAGGATARRLVVKDERYVDDALEAVAELVEEGAPQQRAEEIIGALALQERTASAARLTRLGLGIWAKERGKGVSAGEHVLDPAELDEPPPRRGRRR